jgi:hypothetical protein
MESVHKLTEVGARLQAIRDALHASEPDLMEELDALSAEKEKLTEDAKKELRKQGVGKHEVGGFSFRVSPGKTVRKWDVEEIKELAEELGHEEVLEKYRVFTVGVDTEQIERLPSDIRVYYENLYEETTQSARVTFPNELK